MISIARRVAGLKPPFAFGVLDSPVEPILFEVELETFLKASLGIPVWAGFIPQGKTPTAEAPALVYNLVNVDADEVLDGPSDIIAWTFQFDAYAPKRIDAIKLIARLRDVLYGYSGPMGRAEVLNVVRGNQNHGYDNLPDASGGGTQRRMVEYVIYFREHPPSFEG